jgi:hypothetical protein
MNKKKRSGDRLYRTPAARWGGRLPLSSAGELESLSPILFSRSLGLVCLEEPTKEISTDPLNLFFQKFCKSSKRFVRNF